MRDFKRARPFRSGELGIEWDEHSITTPRRDKAHQLRHSVAREGRDGRTRADVEQPKVADDAIGGRIEFLIGQERTTVWTDQERARAADLAVQQTHPVLDAAHQPGE